MPWGLRWSNVCRIDTNGEGETEQVVMVCCFVLWSAELEDGVRDVSGGRRDEVDDYTSFLRLNIAISLGKD